MGKPLQKILAKVAVAAAWVDGELANAEIQLLQDNLAAQPDLTDEDRDEVSRMLERPVTDAERQALVAELLPLIKTEEERREALATLSGMIQADMRLDRQEQLEITDLLMEIDALEVPSNNLWYKLRGLFKREG